MANKDLLFRSKSLRKLMSNVNRAVLSSCTTNRNSNGRAQVVQNPGSQRRRKPAISSNIRFIEVRFQESVQARKCHLTDEGGGRNRDWAKRASKTKSASIGMPCLNQRLECRDRLHSIQRNPVVDPCAQSTGTYMRGINAMRKSGDFFRMRRSSAIQRAISPATARQRMRSARF